MTKQAINNPIPWYKNYILILIIFIPLATVCGSALTIYLAVSSKEAPVLDGYVKVGLSPQKQQLEATNIEAVLSVENGTLTLTNVENFAEPLKMVMQHASKSEFDQEFTLYPEQANLYRLPPALLENYNHATWYFYLLPLNEKWRIQGTRRVSKHGSAPPEHETDIILKQ